MTLCRAIDKFWLYAILDATYTTFIQFQQEANDSPGECVSPLHWATAPQS